MTTNGLMGKFFMPWKYQFTSTKQSRRILLLVSGLVAGGSSFIAYRKYFKIDSEDRALILVGWEGEYAQNLDLRGHPPLNLNLPPHLRLDMKSYLDNPETVIPPPPAWGNLHPYVQDRYRDVFLDPLASTRDVDTSWFNIMPWGGVPDIEFSGQNMLGKDGVIRRCEEAVLYNQRRMGKKGQQEDQQN
eukprot:TRINITY_DN31371_c0_g1_i1.p1 TRINITY_DN31371_c0_g1~~TRINITY_DN31371_c0_g1_i1.p1  ORF type:complete len:188 (+),score=30.28 TRINITY_DN31371_c0_g1_i1:35-598(+)